MSSYLRTLDGREHPVEHPEQAIECFRCGVCCTHYQPPLTPEEPEAIAGGLGISTEDFLARYAQATYIGYLMGNNYQRGFPEYVRAFNTAFLALPALPGKRLADASSDKDVVVRAIETPEHGTYLAVVNVSMEGKGGVAIRLPKSGKRTDAATGQVLRAADGKITLSFYPGQLRALHLE